MRPRRKNSNQSRADAITINEAIRAPEVRLIDENEENVGVVATKDALKQAQDAELDLILVADKAKPPVARIMDYGKYRYELQKKARQVKKGSHVTETKNVQVKIGTGEHDLNLKARRASEWLAEGHRVKLELYLRGRAKYLEKDFLSERLERFLKLISTEYKVAEEAKKSPKGLAMVIERS